jgi:ATP-binding cassette, subfamily A (ABC1), member 3
MDDGTSYADTVISQCEQVSAQTNYSQVDDCKYFGGIGYIVQYNYTALHAAPLYQALADEALVRRATGNPNFTIEATIDPLPKTLKERSYGIVEDAVASDFAAWFLVVLSFPFISGAFATFIVAERYSKAKHMQAVAGVEPSAYWLSSFIWDITNYQIPYLITIVLMFAFNVTRLTTKDRDVLSGVLTVLALYGPASAGFTYCVTFGYQSASLCSIVVIISGFFIGMGGPLTCYVLYLRSIDPRGPQPELADVADVIAWFLRWNPFFCLGKGLFNAMYIETFTLILQKPDLNAWDPEVLATEVYCLVAQSVCYILLAIQIDKWSTNPHILSLWQNFKSLSWVWRMNKPLLALPELLTMDDDVRAEQELVLSGKVSNDSILIKKLSKVYANGKVAVNNLSLGVAPGECFGLLGINGAGKTTTMSILTAEFPPTSGDAILGGYSVTHEPQKIRRQIGYCPQFCAHFENMTGREHLEMYAAIKGVPVDRVDEVVAKKLEQVGLSGYDGDRLSAHYSGGMKRRLSLACATIGQPRIIFLDECSTGVDPVACRDIWQLVSDMVVGNGIPSQQPAVILTTHSMEECEALCPRIGIMVRHAGAMNVIVTLLGSIIVLFLIILQADGQLRCLGSAQHLKSKFGKGFQLEVKVRHVDRDDTDFLHCMDELVKRYQGIKVPTSSDEGKDAFDVEVNRMHSPSETPAQMYFTIDETKIAVSEITGDDSISNMIDVNDPIGFSIWKEAMSSSMGGVDLMTLATFVTCEIRMRRLEAFVDQTFPKHILRERQDLKARYELDCEGSKISNIFASIEQHKDDLHLEDYSVSQTSLEQVFNMHAAEAERLKVHKGDNP